MPTQSLVSTEGNNVSDIELVDRLLRRVPGAFELFFQRYERRIYHCIRVRANVLDVDDLFQGFFERLVKRDYHIREVWQRGTSLTIYLSAVIRNFVTDYYRSKRSREEPTGGLSELALKEKKAGDTLKE